MRAETTNDSGVFIANLSTPVETHIILFTFLVFMRKSVHYIVQRAIW